MDVIRAFAKRHGAAGFRSEWLYYTPEFLEALTRVFAYDTSIPASLKGYHPVCSTGSSTCRPYRTHGGLLELPLSLPNDESRHETGESIGAYWSGVVEKAACIAEQGGLIVISVHPQPHQSANEETLPHLEQALARIAAIEEIWLARPDEAAAWAAAPACVLAPAAWANGVAS